VASKVDEIFICSWLRCQQSDTPTAAACSETASSDYLKKKLAMAVSRSQ
jgi:hypothetical protein